MVKNVEEIKDPESLQKRAEELATIASKYGVNKVMVGGLPILVNYIEKALIEKDKEPVYAYSERKVVEKQIDGKTEKQVSFVHAGLVPYTSNGVNIEQTMNINRGR